MELLLLCLKIFFVRIVDVSLGTVRTIFIVRNKKLIASSIAVFEVLIWFLVVKEALAFENNSIFIAIAYSLGFAAGTLIGGLVAERLVVGNVTIQVFPKLNDMELAKELRNNGYGVTAIDYKGIDSDENLMLYINVKRKEEKKLKTLINKLDKDAFIVENETRYVQNGYFK
jgi:uncharacterized protein YebE (UPF0316 family)